MEQDRRTSVPLRGLVAEVLARPGWERAGTLDRLCGDDAALRTELEALVRRHEQAADPSAPTQELPAPSPASLASDISGGGVEGPGSRIGPYRLQQLLGEGGFGAVYMAEQEHPVRRRVALKIIKLGMDTRQVIARFEAERQALALMDHPNIAHVLEAGATAAGRPFFVMELVRGVPVTEYCDTNNLSTPQRLELFIPICLAVQHAHQKGIIHRDIKPSNVLVTMSDGKPLPKVIDFGIAKATAQRLTERTLFTDQRQFIGTPEYMSPEQAEGGALDVDTRTDIYSLGVLLYELLTGTLPFDSKSLRAAGYAEIQRIIREVEPPRPSTRLSDVARAVSPGVASGGVGGGGAASATVNLPGRTLSGTAQEIARRRDTDVASLRRLLRGDLDWITLKALEKDRTRRYATASELAAEIERHLRHEPVQAGPPSAAYRLSKFARRHRAGITAGVVVAGALIAGLLLALYGLVEARSERNSAVEARAEAEQLRILAESQRDRAVDAELQSEAEAAKAEQTAAFLREMLASIDPATAQGRDTRVLREMLASAAERVEKDLASQPEVAAAVRATIGATFQSIGEYDLAEPHLTAALELRRTVLGEKHADTAASMDELGLLYRLQGKYDRGEEMYLAALESRRALLGERSREAASTMNNLGVLHRLQSRYDQAKQMLQRALEIRRGLLGEEHADTLTTMNNLAVLMRSTGKFADSEALYLKVLEVHRRINGESHPRTLLATNNLAQLYTSMGRLDEAERLSVQSLEVRRRILGDNHPDTLHSLNNLGMLYRSMNRDAEAERIFKETLEARRRELGEEHPDTLASANSLAGLYEMQGRFEEAEPLVTRTLEIRRRVLGLENASTLSSLHTLGSLRQSQGRYAEAESIYREVLEGRRKLQGDDTPDTITAVYNLATVLRAQKRSAEAEPLTADVLARRRQILGDKHPSTLNAITLHGLVLLDLGRLEEASALLRESVATSRATLAKGNWQIGAALSAYGKCLVRQGSHAEAEQVLLEASEILSAVKGPAGERRARDTVITLVELYEAMEKKDEAGRWRERLPGGQP